MISSLARLVDVAFTSAKLDDVAADMMTDV